MRILGSFLICLFLFTGCSDESDTDNYTGRTLSFSLFSGTEGGSDGNVTFLERTDKSVDILVKLNDLPGNGTLPTHLHVGDLSTPNAPYAAMLSDYDIEKGQSLTNVKTLADESLLTLDRLKNYNGCVKVHLSATGPDKNVIIAAGNIGSNESKGFNLQSVAVCGDYFISN